MTAFPLVRRSNGQGMQGISDCGLRIADWMRTDAAIPQFEIRDPQLMACALFLVLAASY
jgi:hypothetical protein